MVLFILVTQIRFEVMFQYIRNFNNKRKSETFWFFDLLSKQFSDLYIFTNYHITNVTETIKHLYSLITKIVFLHIICAHNLY